MRRWLRHWPHMRAAFVVFHVLAVVVLSLPHPASLKRASDWERPQVKARFARLSGALRGLGMTLEDGALQRATWSAAQSYLRVRGAMASVFEPYARAAGFGQGWSLFLSSGREVSRVHIDLERNGRFEPLFVRGSREHRWLSRELDGDRMRKLFGYAIRGHDDAWNAFARWAARRAAHEFKDATALRVRTFVYDVPPPHRPSDLARDGQPPLGDVRREVVVPLGPLR